ncbi:MAG: hypothetical protein ACLRRT_15830 [Ruthenibacterium lactatiformans]
MVQAEQSVIGCLMIAGAAGQARAVLSPRCLRRAAGAYFSCMLELKRPELRWTR